MHILRFFVVSLACIALSVKAQIPFSTSGTGTNTFDSVPSLDSGWSTVSVGRSFSDIMSVADLNTAIQTNCASYISTALVSTPSQSGNGSARWNSVNQNIQTRAYGNSYTLLMATLQNQTGMDVNSVEVSYDYAALIAAGAYIDEEVPGLLAYYSLTGETNSWTLISALSTNGNPPEPMHLTARINFDSPWSADSPLFLLWADDNAEATSNDTGAPDREGTYTIDNFSAEPRIAPFTVRATPQTLNVDEFSSTSFVAQPRAGIPPYTYQWYFTNISNPLSNATNATLTLTNVPLTAAGTYYVVVQDSSPSGSQIATGSVSLIVTAITPPTLTVLATAAQELELSWPDTGVVFQLQSTTALALDWTQAPEADNPSGGYHRVRINYAAGRRFFRLFKP